MDINPHAATCTVHTGLQSKINNSKIKIKTDSNQSARRITRASVIESPWTCGRHPRVQPAVRTDVR